MENITCNRRTLLALAMMATLSITGCSGKKDQADGDKAANAPAGLQAAMSPDGQKAAAIAALPKADTNVPLTQYFELKSGNQLMFMYYAMSTLPIDYEKIASVYSRDYMNTSDAFKKSDILKAVTPIIDAEVAKAKANRYFMVTNDVNLSSYDFTAKGFSIKDDLSASSYHYYYDNQTYQYSYTNGDSMQMLKVSDESVARQIESLRGNQLLHLRIYAFAQDIDLSNQRVEAQIVKMQLLDAHGNVLFAQ
jgi:hypothetical protein